MLKKNNLFYITLIGTICLVTNLVAATTPQKKDLTNIKLKQIDSTKIEAYRSNSDFVYDRVPPPPETLWESFKRWFWEQITKIVYSEEFSGLWDYFQWVLIAIVLALVVFWVFKSEIRAVFKNKQAANIPHFIAAHENIHKMDFDVLIENAIANHQHREAIRLAYLKILKQLTDKDLINWKIDKTNLDYVTELKNTPHQATFNKITQVFEFVWYGEFVMTSNNFSATIAEFKQLSNKLTS